MASNERVLEKVFSNGDVYLGNFRAKLPHGKGKYTWSDGTVYEGEWEEGKMTGKGQIFWPSGAAYEGEFSGGYLHGFGTFTGPDGSVYKGSWRLNVQHGIGRKKYQNLDVYDGSWREGHHEGRGKYVWSSGSTFIGNWKAGKMCGRGVMKWSNGDLFDGFWLNGLRHGSGCYRFVDSCYYYGTWSRGLKDGRGMYYPAGSMHLPLFKQSSFEMQEDTTEDLLSFKSSFDSEESVTPSFSRSFSERLSIGGLMRGTRRKSHRATSLSENGRLSESMREVSSCATSCRFENNLHNSRATTTVVYDREYMQGVLIYERMRKISVPSGKSKQRSKLPPKEVKKKSYMDIFEVRRNNLKLNLQLGIRYTVGKITPVPKREVRPPDFGDRARIKMYFPRKGSRLTPPHHSVDFHWKDYCPMVFRNLREMFKLDAAEYMMSICGDDGLRELSSPGKSGSIFYHSSDDRFVIKTLRKSELKVFLKMLPCYYNHVKEHENTLITKFFGVHRIKLQHGKKVRFVVMGNMFCTELRIHHRYDLKGSTHGRFTDKEKISEGTTLKDLDLSYEFHMDKALRESLFKQLQLDCMFLESQQIIDYSLLLGLHFRAPEHLMVLSEDPDAIYKSESRHVGESGISGGEFSIPPRSLILVTHEPSSVSTEPGPHIRGNTLRAFSLGGNEVDVLLPGAGRWRVQLGVNMPAQAHCKVLQDEVGCAEIELIEVYDVVLYFGIIDILQDYNVRKKMEHAYKSLKFDPMSISVIEPKLYSKRFINFLEKVFPVDPPPAQ